MESNVRKALADIVRILKGFDFDNPQIPDNLNCVRGAIETAEAAIAEPPRNCDVGTAEEQWKRVREFCKKHRVGIGRCQNCPINGLFPKKCALLWSQMPYESEEK